MKALKLVKILTLSLSLGGTPYVFAKSTVSSLGRSIASSKEEKILERVSEVLEAIEKKGYRFYDGDKKQIAAAKLFSEKRNSFYISLPNKFGDAAFGLKFKLANIPISRSSQKTKKIIQVKAYDYSLKNQIASSVFGLDIAKEAPQRD